MQRRGPEARRRSTCSSPPSHTDFKGVERLCFRPGFRNLRGGTPKGGFGSHNGAKGFQKEPKYTPNDAKMMQNNIPNHNRFLAVQQKRNPAMTTSTVTARRKRDPQCMLKEETISMKISPGKGT